ncbi:uncharacterized protein LOC141850815 [Brevipalpus obovatus]|uniref:uncharacterized protein LOC141850815 n=1 Tax=Brevipalpus obovatus TaxID=246614 RepID=UPI003D9EE43E
MHLAARNIDFCLISGIFFNFYCVTAHINGGQRPLSKPPQPPPPNYPLSGYPQSPGIPSRGNGMIQSDMIKVSFGPSRNDYNRYASPPHYGYSPWYSASSSPSSSGSQQVPFGLPSNAYRPPDSMAPSNGMNLFWPFQQRDPGSQRPSVYNSFLGSSSSSSSSPPSLGSASSSSLSSYSAGYPSVQASIDLAHSSNQAYSNSYVPSTAPAYGHSVATPYGYGQRPNDWYTRYSPYTTAQGYTSNYPLYPHTAEYLSSGYPYSIRVMKAIAELRSPEKVTGSITFEQNDEKVVVIRGRVLGLPPGAHGLHILEKTSKGSDTCLSGDHFNPLNAAHGGKHDWIRHIGDLGNIFADHNGIAYFDMTDQIISLTGDHSILNRTVVITQLPDDLGRLASPESKRNGSSGPPIACGTIELTRT